MNDVCCRNEYTRRHTPLDTNHKSWRLTMTGTIAPEYGGVANGLISKKKLFHLGITIVCLLMSACAGRDTRTRTVLPVVPSVDLARYAGTWYEIARLPMWFQRHCVHSKASYTSRSDGTIGVHNECVTDDGEVKTAEGVATVVDAKTNARLWWNSTIGLHEHSAHPAKAIIGFSIWMPTIARRSWARRTGATSGSSPARRSWIGRPFNGWSRKAEILDIQWTS